jgi:hypothetical protein
MQITDIPGSSGGGLQNMARELGVSEAQSVAAAQSGLQPSLLKKMLPSTWTATATRSTTSCA